MSRVRTRPTREETREKLFQAAAEVFEEQGIGAASIEAIAAAAGLTRGAFYSNFADKDELIIAMLEDHVDRSIRLASITRASGASRRRSSRDPLGRAPLTIELIVAPLPSAPPSSPSRLRRAVPAAGRATVCVSQC